MSDDEAAFESDRAVELGRVVRSNLARLLAFEPDGTAAVRALDQELSGLLNSEAANRDVGQKIVALLTGPSAPVALKTWAEDFLARGGAPARVRSTYSPLASPGEHTPPARFVCPVGNDQVWYRRTVGQAVPRCNTHGVTLVEGSTV
jgi:hypothetical protein